MTLVETDERRFAADHQYKTQLAVVMRDTKLVTDIFERNEDPKSESSLLTVPTTRP